MHLNILLKSLMNGATYSDMQHELQSRELQEYRHGLSMGNNPFAWSVNCLRDMFVRRTCAPNTHARTETPPLVSCLRRLPLARGGSASCQRALWAPSPRGTRRQPERGCVTRVRRRRYHRARDEGPGSHHGSLQSEETFLYDKVQRTTPRLGWLHDLRPQTRLSRLHDL